MNLQAYLDHVITGQIPPLPPDGLSPGGHNFTRFGEEWREYYEARDKCNERGMWPIVDMAWTKQLADWIGQRSALEIMAGGGWIAKALNQHGADIVATDDYSWAGKHSQMIPVYPVGRLHALEAVVTIPADILLISWPPYGDETISAACRLWDSAKPIIYIGENDGGCNAPESFWECFQVDNSVPHFPMVSWDGIHDYVMIGYWVDPRGEWSLEPLAVAKTMPVTSTAYSRTEPG